MTAGAIILVRAIAERWMLSAEIAALRTVSQSASGLVRIEGYARSLRPVTSPIYGQLCCGWHLVIEPLGKYAWSSFRKSCADRMFVEDGTGRIAVNPAEAVWAELPRTSEVMRGNDDRLKAFFRNNPASYFWLSKNRRYEVTEHIVPDGKRVSVSGWVRDSSDEKVIDGRSNRPVVIRDLEPIEEFALKGVIPLGVSLVLGTLLIVFGYWQLRHAETPLYAILFMIVGGGIGLWSVGRPAKEV
jgi:hypothetical protein